MSWSKKPITPLPDDYVVDDDARYAGTVTTYAKWQGYGFIQPDQAGLVPDDKVWVHWSNIQTDDRFPFLMKDMKVQFGLMKWERKGDTPATLRAKMVTNEDGSNIALQDKVDAEKKEFLNGDQSHRYKGTVKFYAPRKGFGYVTLEETLRSGDEEVPKELRVEPAEVNCGGTRPTQFLENTPVEFGIVKNKRGQFMIYNMSMPGGAPLIKANLENRQAQGEQTFQGTVSFFHWRQNWGFIAPEAAASLPQNIKDALTKQKEDAKAKSKKEEAPAEAFYFTKADIARGVDPTEGQKVVFKAYLDDKGVGAFDIELAAAQ